MNNSKRVLNFLFATAAILSLAGCATGGNPKDPFEGMNRKVFAFNEVSDRYVFKPVAEGYVAVTPLPMRTGVANFFGNLEDLWTGANNLFQGKPLSAANDAGRFLINSTIGIFGLFDVASELGLEKNEEDFGQTLARWGVGDGPYLVLPFFGPRTLRDSGGLVVDSYASPFGAIESVPVRNRTRALNVISTRAGLLGAERSLEEAALDKYSFARDFYLRRRRSEIFDGRPPREDEEASVELPMFVADAVGFPASRQLLFTSAYSSAGASATQ